MEVNFRGKKREYLNTLDQVDEMFQDVEISLRQEKLILSSMCIDNTEIYNDFKKVITEQIHEIKTIEINAVTLRQIADETLVSINMYLVRVLTEMNSLINEFYQGGYAETWNRFSDFLEGIQWIESAILGLKETGLPTIGKSSLHENIDRLQPHFLQLTESLENKDVTLTADILKFDILPILQMLSEEVQQIINSEVMHHDH
jgi:hypothetical protein